jgi:hypothetical protein
MSISQPISSTSSVSSISGASPLQAGVQPGAAAVPVLRRALNAETQEASQLLANVTPNLGQNIDTLA